MKGLRFLLLAAGLLTTASASAAPTKGRIEAVRALDSGNIWIQFSVACNDQFMWVVPKDHLAKSAVFSAALAALLAKADVWMSSNSAGANGRCLVEWLQVDAP